MFEVTDRAWMAEILPGDDHLAPDGRVMEVLSEHLCQGWLEGYLLTGRHGLFNCYEAFIHIVDSMFNQHAKWLKVTARHPLAAADRLAQLPADLARLAPGPQRLLAPGPGLHRPRRQQEGRGSSASTCRPTRTRCCRSPTTACAAGTTSTSSWRASSRPRTGCRWTRRSCTARRGIGIWDWASSDDGGEPDVVMACAGDVPTLETLAAVDLLRRELPDLKVRVVNVVDLMRLQPESEHPHGLSDARVRRAVHDRQAGHLRLPRLPVADPPAHLPAHATTRNLHVRGYKEEGTTTTPFDMVMLNDLDRFHLVIDVIDRVPGDRDAGRPPAPADGRPAAGVPRLHAARGRGPAGDPRLAVAGAGAAH